MAIRKKGPPPRNWCGKKKLPWPVAIYYTKRLFSNIINYDLDKGGFTWLNEDGIAVTVNTFPNSFMVQRLH